MRSRSHLATALAASVLILDACATTDSTANTSTSDTTASEAAPRRRRRRRRPVDENGVPVETSSSSPGDGTPVADTSAQPTGDRAAAPSGDDPSAAASTSSFGSPVVRPPQATEVAAHWMVHGGRGRIVCEGNESRPIPPPTPQCPREPSNAAVVRGLAPLERDVLACNPPTNQEGRLPVHVIFGASGYPLEITFPGLHVMRTPATCLGQALCYAHVPTFRNSEADIDYEYVVLVPGAE